MDTSPIEVTIHTGPFDECNKRFRGPVADSATFYLYNIILPHFGLDPQTFRTLLWRTRATIGGSVPLQCVLGTHWSESDMDLYVSSRSDAIMIEGYLLANGWTDLPTLQRTVRAVEDSWEIQCRAHCTQYYMNAANPRLGNAIQGILTFARDSDTGKKRTIQIIICDIDRTLSNIDFACCTVTYRETQPSASPCWECEQDVRLLRNRVTYLRFPKSQLTAHENGGRFAKYVGRGFVFLDAKPATIL